MISTYLPPLANHLWQSTLFAVAAALLTLALRKNPARVRHWVWLAASYKFLVPLSLLIALGGQVHWRALPAAAPGNLSVVMDLATQPFAVRPLSSVPPSPPRAANPLPTILLAVWACGFLGIAASWWIRWRSIRAAVRTGSPLSLTPPIRAVSSPTLLEPGVFGIFRPVLVLPDGIFERLTPAQLGAVIEHELCHVRHRDNLAAAVHMFVETAFWFHPLVWWIGKRMVEERERACDEEVLLRGSEPRDYAEGILRICKLYAESRLVCVAGVTGADLKKRIQTILDGRMAIRLNCVKKAMLAVAGMVAVAAPLLVGVMRAPAMRAQTSAVAALKFEVASVKPCKPDFSAGMQDSAHSPYSPGRLTLTCMPTAMLIRGAYYVFANGHINPPAVVPVVGGPQWFDSARYTVNAKAADNPSPAVMQGPMLQALLEERFGLRVHREIREGPVYDLTVTKSGPKLTPFQEGSCIPLDLARPAAQTARSCGVMRSIDHGLEMHGATLDEFSVSLSAMILDRPVINKTGIEGRFDIHLEYAPDETSERPLFRGLGSGDQPSADAALGEPSIFTALPQQLGLKLVPAKGPSVSLVIDHVERPSEN